MTRLAGLWVGPARMTPLGDFPIMFMDLRPTTENQLFGQADLDAENNLRFGLSVETLNGMDVLVYRNGGLFRGVLRDSRTSLVEADETAGRYRFCAVPQGCGYIDTTFRFTGPNDMVFDTLVRGRQHVFWTAQRKETRATPTPFPAAAQITASWPAMALVKATVRWVSPLTQPGAVWVLLTTTPCAPSFSCIARRSLKLDVPVGATSTTFNIPAVHRGDYRMTAVVDRTKTFATRFTATSGDFYLGRSTLNGSGRRPLPQATETRPPSR